MSEQKQKSTFIMPLLIFFGFIIFCAAEIVLLGLLYDWLDLSKDSSTIVGFTILLIILTVIFQFIESISKGAKIFIFFSNIIAWPTVLLWNFIDEHKSTHDSHYLVYIGILLILLGLVNLVRSSKGEGLKDEIKKENANALLIIGFFLIFFWNGFKNFYLDGSFKALIGILLYGYIICVFPLFVQKKINRNAIIKNNSFKFYYFLIWYLVGTWILLEFLFQAIFHNGFFLDPHIVDRSTNSIIGNSKLNPIEQSLSFFLWIAIPSTLFSLGGTVFVICSIFFSTENKGNDFFQKIKFAYLHFLEMEDKEK